MKTNITRLPRHVLVGLAGLLIAVILASCLAFITLPRFSPRAFAASLQQAAGRTCAQAPTLAHCDHQDPELQGCAADAQTIDQADIKENGFTIGSV